MLKNRGGEVERKEKAETAPEALNLSFDSRLKVRARLAFCLLPFAFLLFSGCRQDMQDQPRSEPYERSAFFDNRMATRPPVEGTVARGSLRENTALYTGKTGTGPQAQLVNTMPVEVNEQLLRRGQDRFNAYCSACHGMTGKGDGMVVRRGFRAPPPLTNDRLMEAPVGHFFDVITNGFGAMPDYAAQVKPEDRWAIVAYIRALQLSQRAPLAQLPEAERKKLEAGGQK
ncbi:MAG TPA: cytochrome c [Pyrinomonadaceae bacterium]|nr:cytochrome c [Pyrinomonadaceae bacterium]